MLHVPCFYAFFCTHKGMYNSALRVDSLVVSRRYLEKIQTTVSLSRDRLFTSFQKQESMLSQRCIQRPISCWSHALAPIFAMSSRPPVDQEPLDRPTVVTSSLQDFAPTGRPPLPLRPSTPPLPQLPPTRVPHRHIQLAAAISPLLLLVPGSPYCGCPNLCRHRPGLLWLPFTCHWCSWVFLCGFAWKVRAKLLPIDFKITELGIWIELELVVLIGCNWFQDLCNWFAVQNLHHVLLLLYAMLCSWFSDRTCLRMFFLSCNCNLGIQTTIGTKELPDSYFFICANHRQQS
jgi:hypothetical protein